MSYTYNEAVSSDKDKVRLLIPDRPDNQYNPPAIFQDEELVGLVNMFGSVMRAAAEACDIIGTREAPDAIRFRLATELSIDAQKVPEYFKNRASMLREQADKIDEGPFESIDYMEYDILHNAHDDSHYWDDLDC